MMLSRRFAPLAVAAMLAVGAVSATAQRLFADFSGTWDVVVQGPEGAMNSTLALTQKGDSVTGTFTSQLGSAALAGMAKGDSIKFNFSIDAGGQVIPLLAVGALKDKDNLDGKIIAEGMGEFPFAAARQGK